MLSRLAILPTLCGFFALAAGAAWAQGTGAAPGPTSSAPVFRPATEADINIPFKAQDQGIPVASTFAAASFEATPHCGSTLPRFAIVDLAWTLGEGAGVTAQRVDISKFHGGFESGAFETTGAQTSSLAAVALEAPEAGVNYYWRVLARSADGWVSSPVRRFRVPVCKADVLEPDQRAGFILNSAAGEQ